MTDVVQIHCPHCRNSLRVPTAWAERPMRCRFCSQVFLARKKPVGVPAMPMAAPKGNGVPVGVPSKSAVPRPAKRASSRGGFPLKAALLGGIVFVGVGVAAVIVTVVLGTALQKMVNSGSPVAPTKTDTNPGNGGTAKMPPQETGKDKLKTDSGKAPATTANKASGTSKGPAQTSKKSPMTPKGKPATGKKQPDTNKNPSDTGKKPPDIAKPPPVAPFLRQVLNEVALLPPATGGIATPYDPAIFPEFPADVLDLYRSDYNSILDFRNREAEFPLRAAIAKTVVALNENVKGPQMRKTLDAKMLMDKQLAVLKNQVKAEQDNVAQRALVLKDLVKELVDASEKYRVSETKRVQVLFDYSLLRLKARVIHVYEYNYNLALIRTDSLVPLEPGDKLYRLTAQEKVIINEGTIKQYVKDLKKGWTEMAKNHPDTPWAILAPREQGILLGLSWQPSKQ